MIIQIANPHFRCHGKRAKLQKKVAFEALRKKCHCGVTQNITPSCLRSAKSFRSLCSILHRGLVLFRRSPRKGAAVVSATLNTHRKPAAPSAALSGRLHMVLECESKAPRDLSEPEPTSSMYGEGPSYSQGEPEEIGSTVCSAAAGSEYLKLKQAENGRSDVTFWDWCKPDADLLEKIWLTAWTQEIRPSLWESEEIGFLRSLFSLSDDSGSSSEEETEEILGSSLQEETEGQSRSLWSTLHPDLVEKILARLPVPDSFFRVALLSKEWKLRFYSAPFRHEVNCCSATSWSSFCPLLVTYNMMEMVGFESSSRRWCRLPTLSYLPSYLPDPVNREENICNWDLVVGCGSLLCFTYKRPSSPVFVTNPLTETWRLLPPCPDIWPHTRQQVHIVCEGGSKTYKVFISSGSDRDHLIWIFDSTDGSWTSTQFSTATTQLYAQYSGAVINGVLHKVYRTRYFPGCIGGPYACYGINSLDLNEKVWRAGVACLYQIFPEIPQKPPKPLLFENGVCKILLCGSKVILVATQWRTQCPIIMRNGNCFYEQETISVFELDLDNGWAVEVSSAPDNVLERIQFVQDAICHGECIYIGDTFPSMLYNVRTREWFTCDFGINEDEIILKYYDTVWPRAKLDTWRWVPITYQPGLNPWLEV